MTKSTNALRLAHRLSEVGGVVVAVGCRGNKGVAEPSSDRSNDRMSCSVFKSMVVDGKVGESTESQVQGGWWGAPFHDADSAQFTATLQRKVET